MKLATPVMRVLAAGMLMSLAVAASAQQAYPNKPIRFIVPFPPGGGTTVVARLVGQKLAENWGQQVIVDNRGGGNTIIGTESLVKSPPDGYTILLVNPAHVTTPLLVPAPFDAIKDFAPVATIASGELVLVLHPSVPAKTLKELIALAKSKPGQLNYASAGTGGNLHLAVELFNMMTGVKMQHIPYKGSGPALTDLIGGQVQLYLSPPSVAVPHINNGKLKAIAISGNARMATLPKVPTFAEGGVPGFDVKVWFGVLAPAGTHRGVIDKLSTEITNILAIPDIKEKLAGQGLDVFISTPEQFAALINADMARYANVIRAANIKLE